MNLNDILYICGGLQYTLSITAIVVILSLYFGLFIGILRFTIKNKFILQLISFYVSFFRFTPLVFQFSLSISLFIKYLDLSFLCILILFLNSSAYISNIIIDSLNGISENIWNTLDGLNIKKYIGIKTFLLPNILSGSFNNLQSEIINITKESSLIGIIGISDIFFRFKEISMRTHEFVPLLILIGILYFCINYLQEKFLSKRILNLFIYSISKI